MIATSAADAVTGGESSRIAAAARRDPWRSAARSRVLHLVVLFQHTHDAPAISEVPAVMVLVCFRCALELARHPGWRPGS